jgi:hypothetical protein
MIAAVASSEPVLDVMRRELKRMSPDVKITNEQIQEMLLQDVLKREVVEGEKADEARKKISRAVNRQLKAKAEKAETPTETSTPVPAPVPAPVIPSTAAPQTAPGA